MTLTITSRRLILILLAVVTLTVVYALGATRAGDAPAVAAALDRTAGSTSGPLPATQPVSASPVGSTGSVGSTGITVGGTAEVAGTPDTLRLDLAVVSTAPSVSEALAAANHSADAVQKSLLGSGVAKKDLQTSGLTIMPEYDYSKTEAPQLKGYQVTESVSAKLRDLARAGDAIGKAVTAGGNAVRVNGISLDLEETGALVTSARAKAFADARTKAEQYAKAAGRALGDVISIVEDVATPSPTPMPYAVSSSARDLASVPIEPGSQDVRVSVTVLFAMR